MANRHHFGWRRGVVVSVVRRMNEVTQRRAWLVLGWVTAFGRVYYTRPKAVTHPSTNRAPGIPSRYVTSQLGQLSLAFLRGL